MVREHDQIVGRERIIRLHACPVRDLARAHPEVACGVHLGLPHGLLTKAEAADGQRDTQHPAMSARLEPFVEPELCLGGGRVSVARYAQLFVPMLWLGMVVGVSVLEAPIKFPAPGVTLAVGLGIGLLVYKAPNGVESILLVVFSAAGYAARPATTALILLGSVAALLTIQVVVVRPPLTKRSNRVLAGASLPRSRMHWVYIVLELAEAGLLIALAFNLAAEVIRWTP